jgi:hypothetical protein
MTDVASLANTKAQFGLNAGSQYANELARRQEAAIRGMGDYATFGRGLQQQGLAGLNQLNQQSQRGKSDMYSMIANLLGQRTGSVSQAFADATGMGVGVSI